MLKAAEAKASDLEEGDNRMACRNLEEFEIAEGGYERNIKSKRCKRGIMSADDLRKCEQFPINGRNGSGCWKLTREEWNKLVQRG